MSTGFGRFVWIIPDGAECGSVDGDSAPVVSFEAGDEHADRHDRVDAGAVVHGHPVPRRLNVCRGHAITAARTASASRGGIALPICWNCFPFVPCHGWSAENVWSTAASACVMARNSAASVTHFVPDG